MSSQTSTAVEGTRPDAVTEKVIAPVPGTSLIEIAVMSGAPFPSPLGSVNAAFAAAPPAASASAARNKPATPAVKHAFVLIGLTSRAV